MRVTRRGLLAASAGVGAWWAAGGGWRGASRASAQTAAAGWSGGGLRSIGESLIGAPRYAEGFARFDYVNPNAPKGGRAAMSASGRFDTFNPFNTKGTAAVGVQVFVYEALMTPSLDEGSTHYGLLAEWMERAPDDTWVAFRLRDAARWHDGRPVTVDDVKTSFELLTTKGRPFYKLYYQNVTDVVDEGDRIVRFRFDQAGNRELPHIMGQLEVLPAHWWAGRDFAEALLEPPLGSGPYRIGAFAEPRSLEFERVTDYWGADLPVNVGQHNFDTIRFEYYEDRDIEFEAFKAGQIDFWDENAAKRWALQYDFPAVAEGKVKKEEPRLEGPKATQGFVMNQRRAVFADRRARRAFASVFDFEWSNKAVYYGQYARPTSFFEGSDGLMAAGVPDGAELALLEPYRAELPAELFTEAFANPVTDGSGAARRQIRAATRLLEEAGFTLRDGALHDPAGAPVVIEFLSAQDSQKPVLDPYLANLRALGVDARLRFVDQAQYVSRVRAYDFDMIIWGWSNSESPGNEQRDYWGSDVVDEDGGRNVCGVKSPIVDALIEKIVFAPDRLALEAASRALDRVLLWEHVAVLQLYTPFERIAYWDLFGHPEPTPARAVGFPQVWWRDAAKAARLGRT